MPCSPVRCHGQALLRQEQGEHHSALFALRAEQAQVAPAPRQPHEGAGGVHGGLVEAGLRLPGRLLAGFAAAVALRSRGRRRGGGGGIHLQEAQVVAMRSEQGKAALHLARPASAQLVAQRGLVVAHSFELRHQLQRETLARGRQGRRRVGELRGKLTRRGRGGGGPASRRRRRTARPTAPARPARRQSRRPATARCAGAAPPAGRGPRRRTAGSSAAAKASRCARRRAGLPFTSSKLSGTKMNTWLRSRSSSSEPPRTRPCGCACPARARSPPPGCGRAPRRGAPVRRARSVHPR